MKQVILKMQMIRNAYKAYSYEPFYMAYETKDGGKEQYNDVIGQYNAMNDELLQTLSIHQIQQPRLRYYLYMQLHLLIQWKLWTR